MKMRGMLIVSSLILLLAVPASTGADPKEADQLRDTLLSACPHEDRDSPIPLYCPWPTGQTWNTGFGCAGYFWGQVTHTGCDYYAVDFNRDGGGDCGERIYAAAEGTVDVVGNDPDGYGYYVKINHALGCQTLYAHLQSNVLVEDDQEVYPYTPLGYCGSSGNVSPAGSCHLHFRLTQNGVSIKPQPMEGRYYLTGSGDCNHWTAGQKGCNPDPNNIWLQFSWAGTECGTQSSPFNDLPSAINALNAGGILHIKPGSSSWTGTISKPMTLQAEGGPVTIGN